MAAANSRDVWITGVGLLSSLADGAEAHWSALNQQPAPVTVRQGNTDLLVHPLCDVDFSLQIANLLDRKRMGLVQATGVYAAGSALESAGLKGAGELLARSFVVVGGAGGERDIALDETIFAEAARFREPGELHQKLRGRMRPSLFLSQLPNMLAGNISILFGVTGGSRTTTGEELAGFTACRIACQQIADGARDIALVGSAFNGQREDLLLLYGAGGYLWPHSYAPVGERAHAGGGTILGSVAAFLVLEAADHARARSAAGWCRLDGLAGRFGARNLGDVATELAAAWCEAGDDAAGRHLGILSGATGVAPATAEEAGLLATLSARLPGTTIRTPGSMFGHGMEASFPFNLALAAIALRNGRFWPGGDGEGAAGDVPLEQVLVTGVGHSRGECVGLLSAVGG